MPGMAPDASITQSTVYRATVRNHAQLAYDALSAWIDGGGALLAASSQIPANLAAAFLRERDVPAEAGSDPVMRAWADDEHLPLQYPVGSLGPKAANQIFDRADQDWRQTLGCNGKADGKS